MAGDIPSTMKAWLVTKNGQPKDALTLKTDHPVPSKIKAGNILIRVSYAALNPADLNFMGNIPNWIPFRRNPIPGLDFAGEVVKIGPSVSSDSGVSLGAEVCGALNVISVAVGRGSLAEYIEVPASKVVVKPKGVDAMDAAGALGIAGQTACIVLKEGGVKAGDRVLVNGASGGVGSVLVQVAKAKGAVVYGVCSAANAEMVKGLGADEVIDYKAYESLVAHLTDSFESKPMHRIFDCVGSDELFQRSAKYLDKEGLFITIVGGVGAGPIVRSRLLPVALGGVPRRYKLLALWPDGAIAKEVAKWIEDGEYSKFPRDSEYSMNDAIKGYERVASKRSRGKVVVAVA
ncbi:putative alcohol dehydrogenase [Diaporthe ampelina]|uniref:Putative alcohol dehydrogenase n=1 Tax=Diaporthe ampelina TaxID=1214573 RepID=A0A0G2FU30_9PEZI|nr:putative alcohol dehydrogenase [Diaporthe ampelina]